MADDKFKNAKNKFGKQSVLDEQFWNDALSKVHTTIDDFVKANPEIGAKADDIKYYDTNHFFKDLQQQLKDNPHMVDEIRKKVEEYPSNLKPVLDGALWKAQHDSISISPEVEASMNRFLDEEKAADDAKKTMMEESVPKDPKLEEAVNAIENHGKKKSAANQLKKDKKRVRKYLENNPTHGVDEALQHSTEKGGTLTRSQINDIYKDIRGVRSDTIDGIIPKDIREKIEGITGALKKLPKEKFDAFVEDMFEAKGNTEMDEVLFKHLGSKFSSKPIPTTQYPHAADPAAGYAHSIPKFEVSESAEKVAESGMMKAAKMFGKVATSDLGFKALSIGGKWGYMQMTNPLIFLASELGHGVLETALMTAFMGRRDTPSQFVGDMVGMVGLGYTMHMGVQWGAQALARSEYGSKLAGSAIDAIIKNVSKGAITPVEGKITVGDLVAGSMRKFIKPVDLGLLKFGAVGATAGLLYTMVNNKKEGFWGTVGNVASSAGLAMLGNEIYHHVTEWKDAKEHGPTIGKKITAEDIVKNTISKVEKSDSAWMGFEAIKEVLNTDAGKEMQDAIDNIMSTTDEGKYVESLYSSIMNNDLEGIVKAAKNPGDIAKNIEGFRRHVENYIKTPSGRRNYMKFANQAMSSLDTYGPDIKDSILKDTNKIISSHVSKINDGIKEVQRVYLENQVVVRNALSKIGFRDSDLESIHEGMTTGLTKTIKSLDDITSGEVVGRKAETETVKVKDVSKANVLTEAEISQKAIASQKRITGWKEKGKVLGMIGLGAFAVATAIDISDRLDHGTDTAKMVNEEKKSQQKKQHDTEKKYHQQAYGAIDMGSMVTQMFQDRIGHHRMGQAKFAPNQYMIAGQTYTI
jgi:hypothetical protein